MQPSAELSVAAVVKVYTVALCAYAEYGVVNLSCRPCSFIVLHKSHSLCEFTWKTIVSLPDTIAVKFR